MVAEGNVDEKWSENKLATVECLRGRLLAERANSRESKLAADKLGFKLIELENRLKEETKSMKKAEKRLISLTKKLQSLNIYYVSDESETSSFFDKSEISSVSSTTSSSTKQEITKSTKCETKEPSKSDSAESNEQNSVSSISENSSDLESYQEFVNPKVENQSKISSPEIKPRTVQDHEEPVDNPLAITLVDTPNKATTTSNPPITPANVKEVLDNLKNIREQIQNSMERRHMIRINSR